MRRKPKMAVISKSGETTLDLPASKKLVIGLKPISIASVFLGASLAPTLATTSPRASLNPSGELILLGKEAGCPASFHFVMLQIAWYGNLRSGKGTSESQVRL